MDLNKNHLLPISIMIAGLLLSALFFFISSRFSNSITAAVEVPPTEVLQQNAAPTEINIKQVTKEDHIRGDINAPVKIIEFSDYECPFCKKLHAILKQVMDEYEESGQVAWVYRHFPLDDLHPVKARKEAFAAECANELGGNEAFWAYSDKIYEITPSNNQLDLALLPQIAEDIGLNRSKFEACLDSNHFDDHIIADSQDAVNSGGTGTPLSVFIAPNGKTLQVFGAQPFSAIKSIIELALKEI